MNPVKVKFCTYRMEIKFDRRKHNGVNYFYYEYCYFHESFFSVEISSVTLYKFQSLTKVSEIEGTAK